MERLSTAIFDVMDQKFQNDSMPWFNAENFADHRFRRLKSAFENPILEPVLLIHNASIQLFTEFNKLLQRSERTIHVLQGAMLGLARKIANRIVKPEFIKDAEIVHLDLSDLEIFKPNKSIFLGGITKPTLDRLLNEGDIAELLYQRYHTAAHCYFERSLDYILRKFPLKDDLIKNAVWIDVPNRIGHQWENVQYFYDRYSSLLSEVVIDTLHGEFCDYQTLDDSDIGQDNMASCPSS